MPKSTQNSEKEALLYKAVLSLRTEEECRGFFADLCTKTEIREMSKRIWAAKRILEGRKYTEIVEETGLSTATITRVNSFLRDGNDGYMTAFSRVLDAKEPEDE